MPDTVVYPYMQPINGDKYKLSNIERVVRDETSALADKNTSESLKALRWDIYELLDRYSGDYGRTIKLTLMQEVEELFKKHTHS